MFVSFHVLIIIWNNISTFFDFYFRFIDILIERVRIRALLIGIGNKCQRVPYKYWDTRVESHSDKSQHSPEDCVVLITGWIDNKQRVIVLCDTWSFFKRIQGYFYQKWLFLIVANLFLIYFILSPMVFNH